MKQSGSLVIMGFLVIGLWWGIGYIQGADSARVELDAMYKAGVEDGKKSVNSND